MTQIVSQEVLDQATEDMKWECYKHWQEMGDRAKQRALTAYLKQPKVMIADLAGSFGSLSHHYINKFPWEETAIEVHAPHNIWVRVSVEYKDPFSNGKVEYDDTIGMGAPDENGYVPMVFKIHTAYEIKGQMGGESTQIQFVSDRSIYETIDTLTGDMADMARDIYLRALSTIGSKIDNQTTALEE